MSREKQIEVITYEEDRLNYFTDLMEKAQKRYKRLFKKFKDAPYLSAESEMLSDAGRQAHFHGDVVEMLEKGYRKQSEVIRCKDCNYFREYSSEYARTTEGADGDCHIRIMNSNNEQYFACQYDDFCSFAKMKGGAE